MPPVAAPISERFWAKVDKRGPGGCWLWTGATISQLGYGQISTQRVHGKPKSKYAHRVAWELTHGPIPDGQHVCHACDVPLCVNPAHLFLGTQRTNNQDAARKGRFHVPRPRRQSVSDEAIAEMRRLDAAGIRRVDIARRLGVAKSFVSQVLNGRRRQHAPLKEKTA